MDQRSNGSRDSSDSVNTNEEFEIVPHTEPELIIGGDGSIEELKLSLQEVLMDSEVISAANKLPFGTGLIKQKAANDINQHSSIVNQLSNKDNIPKVLENKCRADSLDMGACLVDKSASINDEIKGPATRHLSLPLVSPESDSKVFNHVIYLGAATINAPRSQPEILRNMAILHEQSSEQAIEVKFSIPCTSEGSVVLYDSTTNTEIASFKVHRIIFCARGAQDSDEASCFAFTCSRGTSAETAIFQCHVFKCDTSENVSKVLVCFSMAFSRVPKSVIEQTEKLTGSTMLEGTNEVFTLEVTLEIKEEDLKGNFNSCPKDKNYFKLRCNLMRKVCLSVQQVCNNRELVIERCFGLLVTPGRNVKDGDMQLLEAVSMTTVVGEHKVYTIVGNWDPTDPNFEVLNTETPKDTRVYLSVAVDLVILGIQEPVRLTVETKAKIFPQNERFWYFNKKTLTEQFYLKLRESEVKTPESPRFEVAEVERVGEIERKKSGLLLNLRNPLANWQAMLSPSDPDDESVSDNDEPLLSGSGEVSKDCSEVELESWADVLVKWRQNLKQRPRQLTALVHKGVPEALRGEVWQLLAGCHEDADKFLEIYKTLITQESPCEQVIQRDINRTFPAHDFFKESGGLGQDSLYRISKAYSIYDNEVEYCQGLSFLAASLLLHMPEEQAFCVLVKTMFDYQLRDLFRDNFEVLHLRFYQLERLIQDYLPDLYDHFQELSVEAHMFGSQWFLTLFTAKFPLFLVFHILDVFLCEGMDTIFQVSLALLMMSKKELLVLDFEGVLKYFRVSLPKKYRSEETARQLMRTAVNIRIKKLKKYEKEFFALKEQERQQEDPVKRLTRENNQLMQANLRLEQENDDLAHELVTSKIELRKNLDDIEDKAETLSKDLTTTKTMLSDTEDEKRRLETEAAQLKEMCRRELQRAELEITRNSAIISDYKQICSQLSVRLEKEQAAHRDLLTALESQVQGCERCHSLVVDALKKGKKGKTNVTADKSNNEGKADSVGEENSRLSATEQQVRELELELAQTKLALVEAECRNQKSNIEHDDQQEEHSISSTVVIPQRSHGNMHGLLYDAMHHEALFYQSHDTIPGQSHRTSRLQVDGVPDLTHQLNAALSELQSSRNTWFHKTLTSIREATKKDSTGSMSAMPTSAILQSTGMSLPMPFTGSTKEMKDGT